MYLKRLQSNSRTNDKYSPLMYLHNIKRPGENYIVKTILLDDLPILIFAFCGFNANFANNFVGIIFLMFAFWFLYEYGYYENDYVAAKHEKDPVLSDNYHSDLAEIKWWQPWLWSLLFSLIGISLLKGTGLHLAFPLNNFSDQTTQEISEIFFYCLYWLGFLLFSRAAFLVYNYVNKQTRIWLYPILQISRYFGLLIFLPINIIGASVIIGQVFARSFTYAVYRYASTNNWPKSQDWFLRFVLFAIILSMMAFAQSSPELIFNWQTLLISSWWIFRCRKQIYQIVDNTKPIWNSTQS